MKLIDGAQIWKLHAQDGFPIELSIPFLADAGTVPTWDMLLLAAKRDGANLPKLVERLKYCVSDGYDPEDASIINYRLDLLLTRMIGENV